MGDRPSAPDADRRDQLLGSLGELISRGGAALFATEPVVPGPQAFPEVWRATRGGVRALLRRLAWHAGNHRTIVLHDERLGAPPTERKPETRVHLTAVTAKELCFTIEFLGDDDVAGTLAHELGVAFAAVHRADKVDPYRAAEPPEIVIDPDRDLERGSIASVYLGLGVLAANAAFQQYSRAGRWNGAYAPLEYDVLRAGYLPMSDLAFLLAVQAVVRGEDVPPAGLSPPQRDEVSDWIDALRGEAAELRVRLGVADLRPARRALPVAFDDLDLDEDAPAPRKTAFRWRTHRGGVGFVAGAVLGMSVATLIATRGALPLIVIGGAGSGHLLGRRLRVPRCSACATVVEPTATVCRRCGAALRGDIARLSDRLDAEEHLDAE